MTFARGALVPPGAAFQHHDFRRYQAARLLAVIAVEMESVAVAWQVYAQTGRALDLGLIGLAQFLPLLVLALPAGQIADRFERRGVLLACYAAHVAGSLLLLGLARRPQLGVAPVYAVMALFGAVRAFSGPAGSALMPRLVPTEHFSNAVAWSSTVWQAGAILGPALGGVLYGVGGAATVYAAAAAMLGAALILLRQVRTRAGGGSGAAGWGELWAGVRFIVRQKVVLGAISLDMFAVLLGGAVALLPVFARDVLHVGPVGLGWLRSAPSIGAGAMAVLLAYRPLRGRAGAAMLAGVAVFGLATVVFGLSRSFVLSLLALVAVGASDMVSVVIRQTLVQLSTPDAMRGRVSAVHMVFVGTSNQLGEFESGVTAALFGAVPAVVLGGLGTCLVVLVWAWAFPALRRVDRLEPPAV